MSLFVFLKYQTVTPWLFACCLLFCCFFFVYHSCQARDFSLNFENLQKCQIRFSGLPKEQIIMDKRHILIHFCLGLGLASVFVSRISQMESFTNPCLLFFVHLG